MSKKSQHEIKKEVEEKLLIISDGNEWEFICYTPAHIKNGKRAGSSICLKRLKDEAIREMRIDHFRNGHLPKKTIEDFLEEARNILKENQYEEQYEVFSYIPSNKQMITPRIRLKRKKDGTIREMAMSDFRKGYLPTLLLSDYIEEAKTLLDKKSDAHLYELVEVRSRCKVNGPKVFIKRISDGLIRSIAIGNLRIGRMPRDFTVNVYDLQSAKQHFTLVQPEISKKIEILEYNSRSKDRNPNSNSILVREKSTGRTAIVGYQPLSLGHIPKNFSLCKHPKNDILCKLYLCTVSEYYRKPGFFITVGIVTSTGSTKRRYKNKIVQEIFITEPMFNAVSLEKEILNLITFKFGPPDAGKEAWNYSEIKMEAIQSIFMSQLISAKK